MIFGFKGLDKYHTRFMRVLGIPTYLFAITVLWVNAFSFVIDTIIFILVPLAYEFIYVNLVANIQKHSLVPPTTFVWCVWVLVIQFISISLITLMVGMFT